MSIEAIAWKQMIALMCTREVCRADIREHTGLSQTTVNRWLAVLHTRPRNLIYISRYTRSTGCGPYTEWYSFGFCEADVPRPPPLSKREKKLRAARKLRIHQPTEGVLVHESR